jgi:hypothetical protein
MVLRRLDVGTHSLVVSCILFGLSFSQLADRQVGPVQEVSIGDTFDFDKLRAGTICEKTQPIFERYAACVERRELWTKNGES